MTVYIVSMVVLVAFSAYFSATETAFSSLNRTRIKTLCEKGNKKAKLVHSLSDQYDKLISTILIGNNIVNIATSSIATVFFLKVSKDYGATISTVVVTIVILIFGEITPKSVAKDCSESFAMFSAPFMKFLMVVMTPITAVFSAWKKLVAKIFKLEPNEKMSQEELLTLVDEVQQSGSIDEGESELLHNAIEFSECTAQDILTHRVDLEAVPFTATKEEVADKFTKTRYSRLLMYKDSIDDIIGVIHQKDFYCGVGVTSQELTDILTPAVYVTLETPISDILRQMQDEKVHVAIVIDEYGGTYGIVTMEDILEELVGEIWDEHDEIAEIFKKIGDNTYRVTASAEIDEFMEYFGIEDDTDSSTINSWIVKKLGKVPRQGDSFDYENITVVVNATFRHRVTGVDVTINAKEKIEDEE